MAADLYTIIPNPEDRSSFSGFCSILDHILHAIATSAPHIATHHPATGPETPTDLIDNPNAVLGPSNHSLLTYRTGFRRIPRSPPTSPIQAGSQIQRIVALFQNPLDFETLPRASPDGTIGFGSTQNFRYRLVNTFRATRHARTPSYEILSVANTES